MLVCYTLAVGSLFPAVRLLLQCSTGTCLFVGCCTTFCKTEVLKSMFVNAGELYVYAHGWINYVTLNITVGDVMLS